MGGLHTRPPLVRSRESPAYTPRRIRVCGGLDSALQASDASRVIYSAVPSGTLLVSTGPCLSFPHQNQFFFLSREVIQIYYRAF